MSSSAQQTKTHTKKPRGRKVQFNELFYYHSLDKPCIRSPHIKYIREETNEFHRNRITEIYRQQKKLGNSFGTFGIQIIKHNTKQKYTFTELACGPRHDL